MAKKSFMKKTKFKSREDLLNKAFVCPPEKGYMNGGKCIPHKKAKKPDDPSIKKSVKRVLKKVFKTAPNPSIKPSPKPKEDVKSRDINPMRTGKKKSKSYRDELVKKGFLPKKSKKKK